VNALIKGLRLINCWSVYHNYDEFKYKKAATNKFKTKRLSLPKIKLKKRNATSEMEETHKIG